MYQTYSYFADVNTVESVKAHYRQLAKEHHPDLGGDLETMQEINRQYQNKLRSLDGYESTKDNGETFTYKYDEETEKAVADKLAEVLKAGLPASATVNLIGLWLWVTGTEKGDGSNEKLKELGFKWHRERACWYWAPYKHKGRRNSGSLQSLACKYGCRTFAAEQEARENFKPRYRAIA